jgi:UTP:GlnB (protein PII) uridylyltransferase
MHISAKAHCAIMATALAMTVAAAVPASAFTASGLRAAPAVPAVTVKIHDHWNDDEDYDDHHRRRHHRHHHDDVVDAPFTHVETGHRVTVDAPFAHVAVGRYGRHIVAPFVDIWVPR